MLIFIGNGRAISTKGVIGCFSLKTFRDSFKKEKVSKKVKSFILLNTSEILFSSLSIWSIVRKNRNFKSKYMLKEMEKR